MGITSWSSFCLPRLSSCESVHCLLDPVEADIYFNFIFNFALYTALKTEHE